MVAVMEGLECEQNDQMQAMLAMTIAIIVVRYNGTFPRIVPRPTLLTITQSGMPRFIIVFWFAFAGNEHA